MENNNENKNLNHKPKLAIIGSGISGLVCAYFLKDKFDIKLFEKNNYFGGHSNTANIVYDDCRIAVDTGFIVFNYQTYPNLTKLFDLLKVEVKKSQMSFAVKIDNGKLEYAGTSLFSMFAQHKNIFNHHFWQMIFDILKFNKQAVELLKKPFDPSYSLKKFIDDLKMESYFQKYYLLPMASAIWSSPLAKIGDYPAQSFVQFFKNHGLLTVNNQPQWYTVNNGSQNYVAKIIEQISNKVSLNDEVIKISNDQNNKVLVQSAKTNEVFDKVIIASHSDQALKMLANPNKLHQEILGDIKYQENLAVLHKDQKVMPNCKKAWASWVYSSRGQDLDKLSVSYWMNNLQGIDNKYPLFVTLNPNQEIAEQDIFAQYQYHHPIFDEKTIIAQQRFDEIQGLNNLYFCGAYRYFGFHEDGFNSALQVINKLEVKLPWQV